MNELTNKPAIEQVGSAITPLILILEEPDTDLDRVTDYRN
jgi:hypothetical protein